MQLLPLQPGDIIELVAPAGSCDPALLPQIIEVLQSWGLECRYSKNLFDFGRDILCGNTDAKRFEDLKAAIHNPDSRAIWCLRGGFGTTRLLDQLMSLRSPSCTKLFMGFSDITALHLFFNNHWHWPTVHMSGAAQLVNGHADDETIAAIKALLLNGGSPSLSDLRSLNSVAEASQTIRGAVVGGNLSLVQCSLGTPWQIDVTDKIVLLEEVNERAYQVDRMLTHLRSAKVFAQARAVLFGDFVGGDEPDGTNKVAAVLQRFADDMSIPVLQTQQIGHGNRNLPLWLNQSNTALMLPSCKKETLQLSGGATGVKGVSSLY